MLRNLCVILFLGSGLITSIIIDVFNTSNGNINLQPGSCSFLATSSIVREVCVYNATKYLKCPFSNVLYRRENDKSPGIETTGEDDWFDMRCPNDPYFYQACGDLSFKTISVAPGSKFLCSTFVCLNKGDGTWTSGRRLMEKVRCRNGDQCSNGVDELGCKEEDYEDNADFKCSGERQISSRKVCDGVCNCYDCGDEVPCGELWYGSVCQKRTSSISKTVYKRPVTIVCKKDNKKYRIFDKHGCREADECDGISTCTAIKDNKRRPLTNYTRCFPRIMCANKMDHTNCTDETRAPLICDVKSYPTTISKFVICNKTPQVDDLKADIESLSRVTICDDGLDNNCVYPSPLCYTHKHNLCNDVPDCTDKSDEADCGNLMIKSCVRKLGFRHGLTHRIPLSFVNDGVEDCVDGLDEKQGIWPVCTYPSFDRIVTDNSSCEDVYICNSGQLPGFVLFGELCDMVESCTNENAVCTAAQGRPTVLTRTVHVHGVFHVHKCLPGLQDLVRNICHKTRFPQVSILGAETNQLELPWKQVSCRHVYGESYVFLACTGRCRDAACPVASPLNYSSCPLEFQKKTYSLVDNDYLTLVQPYHQHFRILNYFSCDNHRCIPYEKVCDLVNDCGDGSDEKRCNNSFVCNRNSTNFVPEFIPWSAVCDGRIDCMDLSDECNEWCNRQVITGLLLKLSCFVIGSLATLFNLFIIKKNAMTIKFRREAPLSLLNKLLVVLIGVGDLLVGSYLLAIAIVDQNFGSDFCPKKQAWQVSTYCKVLGVISTIGSQLSLFSMTILSLVRVFGIRRGLSGRVYLNSKNFSCICIIVMLLITSSVLLAVVPIWEYFEDNFVGSAYISGPPLFKGLPDKDTVATTALQYHGRTRLSAESLSWKRIEDLITSMFSYKYGGGANITKVSFYGDDPVCLFKYFVKSRDPQTTFTWCVLCVNFTAFTVISFAYIAINIVSRRTMGSERSNAGTQDCMGAVKKRNKRLQRKISLIIATDFLCWMPFIIISFLHSVEIIDATEWYGIFSIVILPINSVINPILYDDYLVKGAENVFRIFSKRAGTFSVSQENLRSTSKKVDTEV